MKKLIFCIGITAAIVFGATVFSIDNNVSAQTYRTTPTYGGGSTTRGSNGSTYSTTPTYGGGSTTRRR